MSQGGGRWRRENSGNGGPADRKGSTADDFSDEEEEPDAKYNDVDMDPSDPLRKRTVDQVSDPTALAALGNQDGTTVRKELPALPAPVVPPSPPPKRDPKRSKTDNPDDPNGKK